MRGGKRGADLPAAAFMWEQFSAYHVDRLDACAAAFAGRLRIVGVEVASRSRTYAWKPVEGGPGWERITLFPGEVADDVPWPRKVARALRIMRGYRARDVFLCNQERPEILTLLPLLRLGGARVHAMLDAKFDDSPRRVVKEALKPFVLHRYNGALIAGAQSADYYRFLGLPDGWARTSYDTISVVRIRRASREPLAPDGRSHRERHFVAVARFVPNKQLPTVLRAFARFRALCPGSQRQLVLCGSGPLEGDLHRLAAELGVRDFVDFPGFLGPDEVARTLAQSLALLLPSTEEQWGLVVNEAVALGVPVLCSDNVGARDTLVRTGVNGFVFEVGNVEGLAWLMRTLSEDEATWRRMSLACRRFAPLADVQGFVRGVSELTRTALLEDTPARPDEPQPAADAPLARRVWA